MSENTKLDPATLSKEEEAILDAAFRGNIQDLGAAVVSYGRALFAPATEKAVCPNCKRDDTGHSWKVNGELRYSCNGWNKPAQPEPATEKAECLNCEQPTDESPDRPLFSDHLCQKPEPAAPRCNGADTHDFFHGNCRICGLNVNPHRKPPESSEGGVDSNKPEPAAQGEMPCPFCGAAPEVTRPSGRSEWIPESAGLGSAGWSGPVTEASCRACGVMRVPLVIWNSRTHSQPVDDEDLQFHINRAEYWIKERVLLGDQKETVLALKVAACKKQPVAVAVGMTEELEHVLRLAEELQKILMSEGDAAEGRRALSSIAAVRQQAAQGRKLELPKVREFFELTRWNCNESRQWKAALAELDAAEGRKP